MEHQMAVQMLQCIVLILLVPCTLSSAVSVHEKLQVHMQPYGLQNSCA